MTRCRHDCEKVLLAWLYREDCKVEVEIEIILPIARRPRERRMLGTGSLSASSREGRETSSLGRRLNKAEAGARPREARNGFLSPGQVIGRLVQVKEDFTVALTYTAFFCFNPLQLERSAPFSYKENDITIQSTLNNRNQRHPSNTASISSLDRIIPNIVHPQIETPS